MEQRIMITDDELLLYYYRELDTAERARIGAALAEQPELAQRLHRLVARLDAAAVTPEVPVPVQFQQRWETALAQAGRREERVAARRPMLAQPMWLAAAAAVIVTFVAVITLTRSPGTVDGPQTASTGEPPAQNPPAQDPLAQDPAGNEDGTAYENGLKWHLASTERRLASLDSATPQQRAQLVEAIISQNRLYALAAERAGEPQLARVLRAFTPILEDVAAGRSKSTAGDLAQLNFELRVMQARLGTKPEAATTL
jgi:hypothetical protein